MGDEGNDIKIDFLKEALKDIGTKIDKLFSKYDAVTENQIRTDERVKLLERFVWGALLTGLTSIGIAVVVGVVK